MLRASGELVKPTLDENRYCHEQAWRFNHRRVSDSLRFDALLSMVTGKRLTYRQLAAIGDAGFMGIK